LYVRTKREHNDVAESQANGLFVEANWLFVWITANALVTRLMRTRLQLREPSDGRRTDVVREPGMRSQYSVRD
jgi:hypothetical protein